MPEPTTLSTTYGFSSFYFAYTQCIERRLFSDIFMYVIDVPYSRKVLNNNNEKLLIKN